MTITLTIMFILSSFVYIWLRWILVSELEHRAPELWSQLGKPSGPREGGGRFVAYIFKGNFTSPPIPMDSIGYFRVMRLALIIMMIPMTIATPFILYNLYFVLSQIWK